MLPNARTLVILISLLALIGCGRSSTPEPLYIGHLAPFTGPDKDIGEHAKQAIALAVDKVNTDGGIAGRPVRVIHPSFRPDDLNELVPVTVRLITVNHVVALLGGSNGAQAERIGRAAQPYEVALVTPAELPPDGLGENVFSVNAGLAAQGLALAQFVKQDLKDVDRVAVLVDSRQAPSTTVAAVFSKELARANNYRVSEWKFKSGSDLSDLVEGAKKLQPKALLHAGSVTDLGLLKGKLQAAGLKLHLLYGGEMEHLTTLAADREASNGVYAASPFVPDANNEFVKKYQERFHQEPDLHAALAYDGLRVLCEAMGRVQILQPGKIRLALDEGNEKPFEKAGGLTFDKRHAARRPLFIGRLEDGKLTNPKRFDPQ
jgi:branched-chain amino acid transport system substrate-binding protein